MKQHTIIRLAAVVGVAAALGVAPTAAAAKSGPSRACPEKRGALCQHVGRPGGDRRHTQRPMIKPTETRDARGVPAWSSGGHVMQ
jgi:hypothetical protein